MKMKHLKWSAALVLSLAMAIPLGSSVIQAQEESTEIIEEDQTTPENETTKEEQSDSTTDVETHYYTVYVKVGETTTVSMETAYDTWQNSAGYEQFIDYKENVSSSSGYATNSITITGKSAGQAVLTRSYTDTKYDLETGFHNITVNEIYTVNVVDDGDTQLQTRTVDVVFTASLKVGTTPENFTEPDGRYYHLGTMKIDNLPEADQNVTVNWKDYQIDTTTFVADPDNKVALSLNDLDSWYSLTPVKNENGTYSWRLQGIFVANDVATQNYLYTDGVENEEIFPDKAYTTVKGTSIPEYNKDGTNPTREGYLFAGWKETTKEDGTIVYEAQWEKEEEMQPASLIITLVDKDTSKTIDTQTIQSDAGVVGETYKFVGGEYAVVIPDGYQLTGEYPTVEVEYGQSASAILYIEKVVEQPEQPGKEDDGNVSNEDTSNKEMTGEKAEQTKGTNTGVAMSLTAVFGTMSVALVGIISLLKKKK